MKQINIPGLGTVTEIEPHLTENGQTIGYVSKPIPLPLLGGKKFRVQVDLYDQDPKKAAFHAAIANFFSLGKSARDTLEKYVFQYYKDSKKDWKSYGMDCVAIKSCKNVWQHVGLGDISVTRCNYPDDKRLYVSLGGSCDWELEHGLEIVFRNGLKLTRVGPETGHFTGLPDLGP